jgi:hydrogenase maturation protease
MSPERARVLVIGIGNPSRGDDAAGLMAARLARARLARVRGVEVVECHGDPVHLISRWAGADALIIADAVRSGAPPGRVRRVDASNKPLPVIFRRTSSHAFGVADALELARATGALPRRVIVYGIEAEAFAVGTGPSPAVASAAGDVARRIVRAARRHARAAGSPEAYIPSPTDGRGGAPRVTSERVVADAGRGRDAWRTG